MALTTHLLQVQVGALPLDYKEPQVFALCREPAATAAAAAGAAGGGDGSAPVAGRAAGGGTRAGEREGARSRAQGNGLASGFLSGKGLEEGGGGPRAAEPPREKQLMRSFSHKELVEGGFKLRVLLEGVEAHGWVPSLQALHPMLPLLGAPGDKGGHEDRARRQLEHLLTMGALKLGDMAALAIRMLPPARQSRFRPHRHACSAPRFRV